MRVRLLLLVSIMSSSCAGCTKGATQSTPTAPESRLSAKPELKDLIIGTWFATRLRGDVPPEMTITYGQDGSCVTSIPDRGGSTENYRVIDERTIEMVGPPVERVSVDVLSQDELKLETSAYTFELKRKK